MVETLIAKVGRKTFQGIANRQRRTARRRPVQPGATHAHRPNLGGATATNMTICTSSFIRTMTVGPGISPDLLTPHVRFPIRWDMHDAGARGLAG
jgi:hypothetical protein